ncbi:uncharacterized protein SCHCODRAFT_02531336 [Schizophyllum commune H4-8]|uniref:uncharacterized protein n=1 Tax=Schizophyllum commune (strain H4-8 / FGSC 9210) TaxID=578458 RepID=UPI00215DEFA9
MITQQQFLSLPPNFDNARAGAVDSNVAIFDEWLECHFRPQVKRLAKRMAVCDNIQAREVLELSGDWDRFTTSMRQLDLPAQSYETLRARTVELRERIGEYWSRYSAAMEKPGDLWVTITPKDMVQMMDWFTKLKMDEPAFQQRLTRDGEYPVFWQIFEKGLCLHLRRKKSWPSASFRKMADWEDRFEFMKRCSGPAFEELGHIQDAVTLAGAVESHYRYALEDALNQQDFECVFWCLGQSMFFLCDHVYNRWRKSESSAVQAICVYLDRSSL